MSNSITVLLAEDNHDHAELIKDIFEENAPQVQLLHAPNGQDLIQQLSRQGVPPQLILLDIKMPRLDGLSTLKAIRSMQPYKNLPILMITTSSINSDITKAKQFGATGYLTKPIQFSDIAPYLSQEQL